MHANPNVSLLGWDSWTRLFPDASKLEDLLSYEDKECLSKQNWKISKLTTNVNWLSALEEQQGWNQDWLYLWYPNQTSSRIQTPTNERFCMWSTNTWTSKLVISYVQSLSSLVLKATPCLYHSLNIIHLILCLSESNPLWPSSCSALAKW